MSHYADGWMISTVNGQTAIWHGGEISGYQSVNARFPDAGIDIIILTNDSTGTSPSNLLPQLFASL